MKTRLNKGFTLIELLVVIAIIGILSGIVLTSLNSARTKAKDARIISAMSKVRTIAETLYSGGYSSTAFVTPQSANLTCGEVVASDDGLYALAKDITDQQGITDCTGGLVQLKITKSPDSSKYVATAKLASSDWWCIDSSGVSRNKNITTNVKYTSRTTAEDTVNFKCY